METTGVPKEGEPNDHRVLEVGWCVLEDMVVGEPQSMLVNPGRDIPPEASAVHHLTDIDFFGVNTSIDVAVRALMDLKPDYWVSFQCEMEKNWFGGGTIPWLCPYRIACRLYPDETSYKLQHLRYSLALPVNRDLAHPAHRAGPDAYVAAVLMQKILEDHDANYDAWVRWSSGPALLPRVNFGKKHRGERWEDVPSGYLEWIVDKSDMDRDTKALARHWLKHKRQRT